MGKKLNIQKISQSMDEKGLNQAGLAQIMGVSRTIVSAWFKGRKFPRPDKLLKLGLELGLPFQDLVEKSVTASEPVVAFRKKGRRKTTDNHIENAKEIGQLLDLLAPYLPFDGMFQPPSLKAPKLDYSYIQNAAQQIRSEIKVKDDASIAFEQMIAKLNNFEVVLIPVFHGQREHHENALHIFLPASKTTWIFINLDSNLHDFKFWMAHELGHVLSPSLTGDSAEDFADTFAQALLFPEMLAKRAYISLRRLRSSRSRIREIIRLADSYTISPITVYLAINEYSAAYGLVELNLEPDIYAATTYFNKKYPNVSEILFDGKLCSASDYIKKSKELFGSPFFEALRVYLSENEISGGFIQSILDCSILDAKEIHAELIQ
ncbi:HigA protein (antitoxin to HigB) [Olavius sp. associated proteobacterium Delta 1]|nr:HigA protein (antitoxin to HigB) [Olavius sp. associated proteobacterium Delta 1]